MNINEIREIVNSMNNDELYELVEMAMNTEMEYGHETIDEKFEKKIEALWKLTA